MNLTLWKRREPTNGGLARLRDEVDRTIDRFFSDPFGALDFRMLRSEGWLPPVDVSENDRHVTVRMEVPGISAKDLEISITGTTLTVAGRKEECTETKDEDYYQSERRFGAFRRSIDLPESVDPDRISAEADNGVVTLSIAKKPGARSRQVEIKPAAAARRVPVTA